MMRSQMIPLIFFAILVCQVSSGNTYKNKRLVVTSVLTAPFMTISNETTSGNDRYEGYIVDLLKELSNILGFNYDIKLVDDKSYGRKNASGHWSGMIGELRTGKADVAAADLTITFQREEAVDFTHPFMSGGLSLLYKKPTPRDLGLIFSPIGLFLMMTIPFLLVTFVYFKRRRNSDTYVNVKNLSKSTRFLTISWKFLIISLIVCGFYYLANYVYCINSRLIYLIESAEDLSIQKEIKYGTVASGSSAAFFQQSNVPTYVRMWNTMSSDGSSFVRSSYEGVQRTLQGGYVFITSSNTIEYIVNRECDLTKVGGLLNTIQYGLAVPKDSPYRALLSDGILHLQETGILHHLKNKWWNNPKINCGEIYYSRYFSTFDDQVLLISGLFIRGTVIIAALILAVAVVIEFIANLLNSKSK